MAYGATDSYRVTTLSVPAFIAPFPLGGVPMRGTPVPASPLPARRKITIRSNDSFSLVKRGEYDEHFDVAGGKDFVMDLNSQVETVIYACGRTTHAVELQVIEEA